MDPKIRKILIVLVFGAAAAGIGLAMAANNIPFYYLAVPVIVLVVLLGGVKSSFKASGKRVTPEEAAKITPSVTLSAGTQDQKPEDRPSVTIDNRLQFYTYSVYACCFIGVLLPPSFLVAFLAALVKRGETAGTIYESHLNWVIQTFLLFACSCVAIGAQAIAILAFIHRMAPPEGDILPQAAAAYLMLAILAQAFWVYSRINKGFGLLRKNLPAE